LAKMSDALVEAKQPVDVARIIVPRSDGSNGGCDDLRLWEMSAIV